MKKIKMLNSNNKHYNRFSNFSTLLSLCSLFILSLSSFSTEREASNFFHDFYQKFQTEVLVELDINSIYIVCTPTNYSKDYVNPNNTNNLETLSFWDNIKTWWDDVWSTEEESQKDKYTKIIYERSERDTAILSKFGYIEESIIKRCDKLTTNALSEIL